jgi:hypothetical protein
MLLAQQYNVMFNPGGAPGPTATPTATPEPGVPEITLNDDFSADNGNWATRSGMWYCNIVAGELETEDIGICHYSGADQGTQPTSRNQWALLEHGANPINHRGPVLRVASGSSNPGSGVYNYAARCSGDLLIRSCNSDAVCLDIAAIGSDCDNIEGDQIALAVDGEGDLTELCVWYWIDGVDSDPSDWTDPTTWGNPDLCTSADGNIDNDNMLAVIDTVPEDIVNWGSTGPDDRYGFPDEGQTDIGIYSGGSGEWNIEWVMAGDLD